MEVENEGKEEGSVENGKVKSWKLKKRMNGLKINKKVKKRSKNDSMRKILKNKNEIMVINELKNGIKFNLKENKNDMKKKMFVVNEEVEGKINNGKGM